MFLCPKDSCGKIVSYPYPLRFHSNSMSESCKTIKIAELLALSKAHTTAFGTLGLLGDLRMPTQLRMLTDNMGLYLNLYTNNVRLAEQRFLPHIFSMRTDFNPRVTADTPHRCGWIPDSDNIADALTKHKGAYKLCDLLSAKIPQLHLTNVELPKFIADDD